MLKFSYYLFVKSAETLSLMMVSKKTNNSWVFFIIFILLMFQPAYSQDLIIDSLLTRKANLEKQASFKKTDTTYIKILNELAKNHVRKNYDSTRYYVNLADSLSVSIDYEKGHAYSEFVKATSSLMQGDFEDCLQRAEFAVNTAKRINADSIQLQGLNLLGLAYFLKGDMIQSYPIWQQGKSLAEELGNVKMQVYFNSNIASSFSILKDEEQALKYYGRSLELLKEKDDEASLATHYVNMSELHMLKNELETAKSYAQLALPIIEKLDLKNVGVFNYITLGKIALAENNLELSYDYFKKSMNVLSGVENYEREAEALLGLANVHFQRGDIDSSETYALKGKTIIDSIQFQPLVIASSEFLAKVYEKKNEPRLALNYLDLAKRLSDSISKSQSKTKFLMIEAENDFQRTQKSIEAENQKKIAQRNLIVYSSILISIVLTIIVFLIRKNVQIQKVMNEKLQQTNDAKDKIFSIIGHDLKSPIGALQELLELYKDKEITAEEISKITPRLKENIDNNSFMLNNLLLWAQTQMEGIKSKPEEVVAQHEIEQTVKLFSESAKQKNIALNQSNEGNTSIWVDREHLRIILRNLVSNAIKFSENGGQISLSTIKHEEYAELTVCDSGIGMSKNAIATIKGNAPIKSTMGTDNEKGTGLGLLILKELVDLNKGRFEISSQGGKGTCFHIFLPKES